MAFHLDLNTIVLLVVALINAYVAIVTHRTGEQMNVLEKNTNSIKDALVASTAKASQAEGHAQGLAEGRGESKKK